MRVISEDKPNVWDEKVVVEMSVKELAILHASLGKTTTLTKREQVDSIHGKGTFDKICEGNDLGLSIYADIDDLLLKKGVLK